MAEQVFPLLGANRFWIGLEDPDANPSPGDTERFEYVDGFQVKSFFADPFDFPWLNTQPNSAGNNPNCVEYVFLHCF